MIKMKLFDTYESPCYVMAKLKDRDKQAPNKQFLQQLITKPSSNQPILVLKQLSVAN